ncbi:hypothetical protein NE237_026444 [Protea cynaroides]|uniref:Uncharacterized protein n=1 Tax=Protea cynaroides TaxID=273540 RepID=A0A9Q0H6P8_9MAGN|nr:hypothetical protein NE237_026444 [Protea cynaroides]
MQREMETSGRDSRRRKIAERGNDRLALITGRIQNLPSTPSSPSSSSGPHHAYTASLPDFSLDSPRQQSYRSTQSNVSIRSEEVPSSPSTPKYETSNKSAGNAAFTPISRMAPQVQKCETSVDNLRTAPLDISSKTPASLARNLSTKMVDTEPRSETQQQNSRIFTTNRIISSISASERTRLRCSIGIALFVVLSHLRFPLLGRSSFVGSTIAARPVYLILLTDFTLVLARLFGKKENSGKAQEEAKQEPSEDGYDWTEGLGKALEIGLVLQKVIGAAFRDCSVYLVIVVCGLCLLQL